jgi:hypothetical protein
MADDQATLETFAAGDGATDSDEADPGTDEAGGDADGPAGSDAAPGSDDARAAVVDRPATEDELPDDLVCPWCLAPADRFVADGLTGRSCGRCAAVLPVGADWFHERDVVTSRPMYEPEA